MEDQLNNKKISSKKKWILVCCYLFGFYLGAHSFYANRYKKGCFYLFSITGIFSYYSYLLHKLTHSWFNSWVHFSLITWFAIYTTFNIVVQHIPFFGWTAYFGTYLVYLFILAIFLVLIDGILILFGFYKDSRGNYIVSQYTKNRHTS